jgi:hypothetical protein
MQNSIQAFGAFGEVSIPASRLSFGIVKNDRGTVGAEGETVGAYKTPYGAFDNGDAEIYATAERRGHKITGFISAYLCGIFYTID